MEVENVFNNIKTVTEVTSELKPKQIRKKRTIVKVIENKEINYNNYVTGVIELKTYKLPELKSSLKTHGLPISGKKEVLIERIETHFMRTKRAILIQRAFRGSAVRHFMKLKGPAFRNRKLCVNDTDFITMEPLAEISNENFYSYEDKKKFVYGFDVASLIQLMKTHGKIENPYNREKFSPDMIRDIKTLYNLCFLVFPGFKTDNMPYRVSTTNSRPTNTMRNQISLANINNNNNITRQNNEMNERLNKINEIRRKPVPERINNLFTEIDLLGNYTQSGWFHNLDLRQYIRFYRTLYEIWNYRANLTREVKHKIYPYSVSPFEGVLSRITYRDDLTLEQIQAACLTVFENMTYSGVDEDHRKLGAIHSLSALTIVSENARQSMPWLYESLAYY